MNRGKAHSLYTTNDRGVNEVAPQETSGAPCGASTYDLFIEPSQLTRQERWSATNTILNDRDVDSTTCMMYALRSAAAPLEVVVRRSLEWLSRCHAQFDGSGPCKRIMGKAPTEGFCFVPAQSWTRRAIRTSLGRSQRDLNPCFNPTTTSPLFFRGFEHYLQVRKGRDSNTKA
jgi:hypothetical protein